MPGTQKQKHKKNSLLAMPVLRTCRQCCGMSDFKHAWISHTTTLTPPSPARAVASPKGLKPLAFGEKPNPVGTWYFTSAHNCSIILNINHLTRTRSIASLPCKIVLGDWYNLFSRNHFIIRVFSPWNGERFLSLGQKNSTYWIWGPIGAWLFCSALASSSVESGI